MFMISTHYWNCDWSMRAHHRYSSNCKRITGLVLLHASQMILQLRFHWKRSWRNLLKAGALERWLPEHTSGVPHFCSVAENVASKHGKLTDGEVEALLSLFVVFAGCGRMNVPAELHGGKKVTKIKRIILILARLVCPGQWKLLGTLVEKGPRREGGKKPFSHLLWCFTDRPKYRQVN